MLHLSHLILHFGIHVHFELVYKKPQELAAASLVEGGLPFQQLPKKLVEKVEKFTEKLDLEKQLEYYPVVPVLIY